ncbi:MAG: hypothetical protein ACREJD_15230 [Phycisphaerales bacterium]
MKCGLFFASALCSASLAGYTATLRTSIVSESSWADPSQTVTATTKASTTAFAPLSYYEDLGNFRYSAQTSSLAPLGATYSGQSYGSSSGTPQHMSGFFSTSSFELRFTLTIPTVFHLDGSIQRALAASSSILLQGLGGLAGIKYQAIAGSTAPFPAEPVHFTGTLPAGSYRLVMNESGQRNQSPIGSGTTCSFIFAVASCAGDLNADAIVDDSDFVPFASAYNTLDCADPAMPAGCPADLNLDGFVDDADFVLFAAAYDALVCP